MGISTTTDIETKEIYLKSRCRIGKWNSIALLFYLTIYIELYGPLGFVEVVTPTPPWTSNIRLSLDGSRFWPISVNQIGVSIGIVSLSNTFLRKVPWVAHQCWIEKSRDLEESLRKKLWLGMFINPFWGPFPGHFGRYKALPEVE